MIVPRIGRLDLDSLYILPSKTVRRDTLKLIVKIICLFDLRFLNLKFSYRLCSLYLLLYIDSNNLCLLVDIAKCIQVGSLHNAPCKLHSIPTP